MDLLSEENHKHLLTTEWTVKIDTLKSTPYLIKFYSSPSDYSSVLLITDTKHVWTETLSSAQFARRWRECNNLEHTSSTELTDEEEEWRIHNLDVLTKAHSLGGIADLVFEVVETNFSDFAFTLEGESFQWRWETCSVGYKASAEILSKHLILPLISMTHLAFSSSENVTELSDTDMGKAIDKVARTSRRNMDLHVRNAFSKPRVASSFARMTATFNFSTDIPAVKSSVEKPEFEPQPPPATKKLTQSSSSDHDNDAPKPSSSAQPSKHESLRSPHPPPSTKQKLPAPAADSDSETEDDEDEPIVQEAKSPSPPPPVKSPSPAPPPKKRVTQAPSSDTDSSPVRPVKKTKAPASSSDDSDDERNKPATKRATRQPIKRGGKRF